MAKQKTMNDMVSAKPKAGDAKKTHYIETGENSKKPIKMVKIGAAKEALREADLKKAEEDYKKIQDYNNHLLDLDPAFSSDIEPRNNTVILRMFHMDPKTSSGIVIGYGTVKIPKAKPGDFEDVLNVFPYTNLGVVVNYDPKLESYAGISRGDIVQVADSLLMPMPVPGTREGTTFLPHEFRRWDHDPQNMDHKGYLWCTPGQIVAKVLKHDLFEDASK